MAVAAPGLVSGTVGTVLLLLLLFFVLFAVCYDGKKQLEIRKQTAADDDEVWGNDKDEVVTSRYSDFFFQMSVQQQVTHRKSYSKVETTIKLIRKSLVSESNKEL